MLDVLVIEDDKPLREHICEGLSDACYQVFNAQNGQIGLRMFKEIRPAVVITDLIMEGGEGIESILSIRQIDPQVKIIAISGNPDYLLSSGKLGADKMLLKPFRMNELIGAIEAPIHG